MKNKKKSIIEELKSGTVSFKKWFKYVSLYNVVIKRLTINECISFLTALIETNVSLNSIEENNSYNNIINKLQKNLEMIRDLKKVIGSNKVNKKTKI